MRQLGGDHAPLPVEHQFSPIKFNARPTALLDKSQSIPPDEDAHSSASSFDYSTIVRFNKEFLDKILENQIGFTTLLKNRHMRFYITDHLLCRQAAQEEEEEEESSSNYSPKHGESKDPPAPQSAPERRRIENVRRSTFVSAPDEQCILLERMLRRIELNNQLKNRIEEAIIEFNAVPKLKTIRGLLNTESQHIVAEFLLTTPGLSKEKIGVFLGHPE